MDKLAEHSINAFRTASERSSSETMALKLEIEELSQRIIEQDTIIAVQAVVIEKLESEASKPKGTILYSDIDAERLVKDAKSEVSRIEEKLEEFEDRFKSLYANEGMRIDEAIKTLGKLPATPELKELMAALKRRPLEISRARRRNELDPFHAYEELRELGCRAFLYLYEHPRSLEPVKIEEFRARVIADTMEHCDSLTTPEVAKLLTTIEGKKIFPVQARRAMETAANSRENLEFDKPRKGRHYRLVRIKKKRR